MIRRLALTLVAFGGLALVAGCPAREKPVAPANSADVVVGRLTAVRDDRPVDGGVVLTLEVAPQGQEVARVPSIFIAGPPEERERIRRLHEVVDAAKIGDRLRVSGHRIESGELIVAALAIVN